MTPQQAEGAMLFFEKGCQIRWNRTPEEVDEIIEKFEDIMKQIGADSEDGS